jgi:hypothetical protein
MSQDQAKKFLEQLNEDKELQQKVIACFSIDDRGSDEEKLTQALAKVVEVANAKGYEVTEAEALAYWEGGSEPAEGELNEEELEAVAGGYVKSGDLKNPSQKQLEEIKRHREKVLHAIYMS